MTTKFEYMNESAIDSELICTICYEPFNDPCCTPCDEMFCRHCITSWLQTGNKSCPLCRKPLSIGVFTEPVRMIRNLLAQIPVKCVSCQQTNIRRGDFADHVSSHCQSKSLDEFTESAAILRSAAQNLSRQKNLRRHHLGQIFYQRFLIENGRRVAQLIWNPWILLTIIVVVCIAAIYFCVDHTQKYPSVNITRLFNQEAIDIPVACRESSECLAPCLPFENSVLLTSAQQNCLNYFYNYENPGMIAWKLIYRGSIHGFSSKSFHTYCDDQGETFVILSTTQGYLFGGYTDVSWTTPRNNVPHYNTSDRSFLFSLESPQKSPVRKFSLNWQYQEYSIVNDQLSGPIFGGMSRPDIGIYESNQRFRCQIHFPIVYKSAIGVSSFPNSQDCIIQDIEVFIPAIPYLSHFVDTLITYTSFVPGCLAFAAFSYASILYSKREVAEGRLLYGVCLLFIGVHYNIHWMPAFIWLYILFSLFYWHHPQEHPGDRQIRIEKNCIVTFLILLMLRPSVSYFNQKEQRYA